MMDTELFSIEAEQAILGDILLKPNIVSRVSGLVRPEDFYRPAHKDTFAVMQQMALEGAGIDIVNLTVLQIEQNSLRAGAFCSVFVMHMFFPFQNNIE